MNIVKELNILLEDFKFTPRRLESREEEKTKKLERLLQQTHIEDDLDLRGTNITSLGNLEYVEGSLNLLDTNITYIDPSIIIKGSIYKDNKTFQTIKSFNKYYQEKQNLRVY